MSLTFHQRCTAAEIVMLNKASQRLLEALKMWTLRLAKEIAFQLEREE